MPTRNAVLTERQAKLVDVLVQSGRHQNASEVLCDGLRPLERREARDAAALAALREAAAVGMESLERGAFIEFADSKALRAHLDKVADRVFAGA